MKSYDKLINDYIGSRDETRLGQYFCNNYINQSWPELYHQTDYFIMSDLINQWLKDHQYIDELPEKLK